MKKTSILASLMLFVTMSLFAADVDKYMADLDSSKDEKTIIAATDWMRDKKEENAVPKLINLVNDSRELVRIHAIMALAYIGDESAVDTLNNALLNDANPSVRYTALLSIMRIGSKKSVSAIEQAKLKETDPAIKDLLDKIQKKAEGK